MSINRDACRVVTDSGFFCGQDKPCKYHASDLEWSVAGRLSPSAATEAELLKARREAEQVAFEMAAQIADESEYDFRKVAEAFVGSLAGHRIRKLAKERAK